MTEGHRTFAETNISNSQAPGDRPPPPKCHMKEKRTPRYQVCVNEKQNIQPVYGTIVIAYRVFVC